LKKLDQCTKGGVLSVPTGLCAHRLKRGIFSSKDFLANMKKWVEVSFTTLPEACCFCTHHPNAYAIILHETLNQSGTCKHHLQNQENQRL